MTTLAEQYEEAKAAVEQMKAQRAALQIEIDRNAALVQEAIAHHVKVNEKVADLSAREKVLQDSTEGLAAANRALNDEKTRWEKIRQAVDAEHIAKAAELTDREAKVEARERQVEDKLTDLGGRHLALADAERRHQGAADHAARFLRALDAPAP